MRGNLIKILIYSVNYIFVLNEYRLYENVRILRFSRKNFQSLICIVAGIITVADRDDQNRI